MKIEELNDLNDDFKFFTENMPKYILDNYFVGKYKTGDIISRKQDDLENLGILVHGETRVINEFENGNIYMIESNPPIDYIGEVTILANQEFTSVTIEASKPCIVFFVPRKYAEKWIFENVEILKRISSRVAYKLYRSSIEKGMKLFYPSDFILIDYIVKNCIHNNSENNYPLLINKTRIILAEEIGMNIKTLNRTITKLKKENILSLEKGKILVTLENYLNAVAKLDISKSN